MNISNSLRILLIINIVNMDIFIGWNIRDMYLIRNLCWVIFVENEEFMNCVIYCEFKVLIFFFKIFYLMINFM